MRDIGPKHKACRREGIQLCNSAKCPLRRRKYPPGMHGPKQGNVRLTEYGSQLRMKQRLKRTYGLAEKQFRKFFENAARSKGDAAENLLKMLELRLDNVVFRIGMAETRPQARQIVNHGHILVNGVNVDIPSYSVKVEDVISVKESKKGKPYFVTTFEKVGKQTVDWIMWDRTKLEARVVNTPDLEQAKQQCDIRQVVEYYSR